MGDDSVVARMAEDVRRMNAEKRGGNRGGEDVVPSEIPSEVGPEPPQPPPDPGPPRIKGVDIEHGGVVSSVGNFLLNGKEVEAIVRIALGALRRSQTEMFNTVASNHKITRLRKEQK